MIIEFYNKEFPGRHYVEFERLPEMDSMFGTLCVLYKEDESCDFIINKGVWRKDSFGSFYDNEDKILFEDIVKFYIKNGKILIAIDKNNNYYFYDGILNEKGEIDESVNKVLQILLSEEDLIKGFLKIQKEDVTNNDSIFSLIQTLKSALQSILYELERNNDLEYIKRIVHQIKSKLNELNVEPTNVETLIDDL